MNNQTVSPCCILTCYYQPNPGGLCNRLFRGIQALLDRGHTVHYLAVVPFPINHQNCYFHRFPWPTKHTANYLFWACFHLFSPMLLLFIGIRYPVNRLVALGHTYSFVLQPLRIIKKVPLLLFLHSDVQKTHEIKGRSILLRYLEYITEGFGIYGARMYTVSEVLMNTINNRHNILKPESTRVLRNEIAVPQQNDMKKKEIRCIRPPVRTACVGVLEPRKNQRFILDVFKKIPAEKAQLYLYGVGPDEQLLRDRVEKEGLTDQVHFMGWVQSDRIWPNVDLLLMPSLHEGAPLAVLEALGYGVAVLASAIPEHAEILPQEWLLPLANTTIWRNKITFLSDAPAVRLQEIISEQKIFAWELQFDWDEKFANCCIMS